MFKLCLVLVAIILLFGINMIDCFMTLIPVLNKIVCKFNDRIINITHTFEQPESITNQSVTFEMEMVRELKEMKMTIAYYAVNGDTINRMLKRTVDVCTYVKRPSADRLVKVVYDHIERNNRIPKVCPIAAHELFYIRHLRPAAIRIPGFLPESSFMFDTNFHTGVLFEPMVEILPIVSRMECKYDDRLVNLSCLLGEPNSSTNQTISIAVQSVREIKEIKLTAAYHIITGDSRNRILRRTVDLCSFVKRPNMDRLIKVFYDQVLDNNRFITACPVAAKEQFYVRDLRPSAIRIPGFLPESSFIFENSYQTGVLFETFVEVRYFGKLTRFLNDRPLVSKKKNKVKEPTERHKRESVALR